MILDETQKSRDLELSALMGIPLETVESYPLAAPESIRIFDGSKEFLSREEMEGLYRSYDFMNVNGYIRTLMMTSVERRHSELLQLLRTTSNARCLDFGSGVGTHAIALLEGGNEVTILDVQGPLMDFALKRIAERGFVVRALLHEDALALDEYDVIICSDVLEHVFDPIADLTRMSDALRKGGIMHLLVSAMKKATSGHFSRTIDRWLLEGPAMLEHYFEPLGATIFKKITGRS
jgi:2-polyprenyl-3-methyl-5-hydroxy-6-metoxy-1,4-benzoquinol methylase